MYINILFWPWALAEVDVSSESNLREILCWWSFTASFIKIHLEHLELSWLQTDTSRWKHKPPSNSLAYVVSLRYTWYMGRNHCNMSANIGNILIGLWQLQWLPEYGHITLHAWNSLVRRQKGLTGYCFKYTDRPFCLRADKLHPIVCPGELPLYWQINVP